MNVRMDDKGVRFRISPEELTEVSNGHKKVCALRIGDRQILHSLQMIDDEGPVAVVLSATNEGLSLGVRKPALQQLQDMGRSKAGLNVVQDGIDVSLQVDVKTYRAERRAS